eukprot:UN08983
MGFGIDDKSWDDYKEKLAVAIQKKPSTPEKPKTKTNDPISATPVIVQKQSAEKSSPKSSIRALTAFELRTVLNKIDKNVAEIFYSNNVNGQDFIMMTNKNRYELRRQTSFPTTAENNR